MTEESQPGGLSKLLDEDSQANPGKGPSTVGRMAHVLLRVLVCFFCVVYIYINNRTNMCTCTNIYIHIHTYIHICI
jgi:hypothetical protein